MKTAAPLLIACLLTAPCAWSQAGSAPAPDPWTKQEHALKMPEIVEAMGLRPGARAADIGAGGGNYEPALSRSVGATGQVYAEDIDAGAIKQLRQHIRQTRLRNVTVVKGVADDPGLPAGQLDAVLMVIAYHEVADAPKMLAHIATALKPGGRLVIVDMTPHKTIDRPRADQVKNHVIAPDTVQSEVRQTGFEVVSRDDHFIDHPDEESTRWMIVCRKPW